QNWEGIYCTRRLNPGRSAEMVDHVVVGHHGQLHYAEALKMKQVIGLAGGIAMVSGTMIGSGIFMSPQFVLACVGSPGASLLIWALSGAVALFAVLSYTELGTILPESGGKFIYILKIYGSFPAFFAAVTFILLVKPFSIAAMSISIAEYAMAPFYFGCQPP
uniref:Zmp:0000001267 n=1 Tax=Xiphophorus maculatus TaxID=8083 RepID=A0A3B5R4U1_XIPMA